LAVNGDEQSCLCLGCFTPGTLWIGGWGSPKADMDSLQRNILPLLEIKSSLQSSNL